MLLVVSDIHGSINALNRMLDITNFSDNDKLIVLGDTIDRGKNSKLVLEKLYSLRDQATFLIGNHEILLMNAMESVFDIPVYFNNGGLATLQSFGIEHPKQVIDSKLNKYVQWMKTWKYKLQIGQVRFVHGGLYPYVAWNNQHISDCTWIRSVDYEGKVQGDKDYSYLIAGHTVVLDPKMYKQKFFLNIDGGYVFGQELRAITFNNIDSFHVTSDGVDIDNSDECKLYIVNNTHKSND